MVSGWLNDGAGSGIPFRLTLQQAALVSATAADTLRVRESGCARTKLTGPRPSTQQAEVPGQALLDLRHVIVG
jgi:hypothetical protein